MSYFQGISRARYLIRKLFRIFDEHARSHGLESLQHQSLIQIAGRDEGEGVSVGSLAHWLDIPPALASRQVSKLSGLGFVYRSPLAGDRRVTAVRLSPQGRAVLEEISRTVVVEMRYFRDSISTADRRAALEVFLSYVGVPLDGEVHRTMDGMVRRAEESAESRRHSIAVEEAMHAPPRPGSRMSPGGRQDVETPQGDTRLTRH